MFYGNSGPVPALERRMFTSDGNSFFRFLKTFAFQNAGLSHNSLLEGLISGLEVLFYLSWFFLSFSDVFGTGKAGFQ